MFRILILALPLVLAPVAGQAPQAGQRGMMGGRGMMQDAGHQADMQVLHALFDNRAHITRKITVTADGVDTLTESGVPAVTKLIQEHVAAMAARVDEARPIHQRDPLFQEIFKHAKQIDMKYEQTATGIRVIERSDDPYVVKLIQAHAEVISAFIANGMAEAMKNHPVPVR
jgi:hypothetical protein